MSESTHEKTLEKLETLAIESCLSIEEFTLQGMTLGAILSTGLTSKRDIGRTIMNCSETQDFNSSALDQFIDLNLEMLESDSFEFQLLIPDFGDAQTRLEELCDWITGFFETFGDQNPGKEADEILEDFRAIADVETELDYEDSITIQENMVEECIEHTRVSLMLLYEILRAEST